LALVLERGLKTGLMYAETIEMKHDLVRTLFPRVPSVISRKPYLATKHYFADAELHRYLERTITHTGARRRVEFPVKLRLILGLYPKSLPDHESRDWKRRPIQRLRVSFFNS
jgi:hypothetical protein